jgi:hypothetical protein
MGATTTRKHGVTVHTVFCRNDKCEWHNTSWLVQVNADGSVPEAYKGLGKKQFPKLSKESEQRIRDAMDAQLKAETSGQGEIRNPFSS